MCIVACGFLCRQRDFSQSNHIRIFVWIILFALISSLDYRSPFSFYFTSSQIFFHTFFQSAKKKVMRRVRKKNGIWKKELKFISHSIVSFSPFSFHIKWFFYDRNLRALTRRISCIHILSDHNSLKFFYWIRACIMANSQPQYRKEAKEKKIQHSLFIDRCETFSRQSKTESILFSDNVIQTTNRREKYLTKSGRDRMNESCFPLAVWFQRVPVFRFSLLSFSSTSGVFSTFADDTPIDFHFSFFRFLSCLLFFFFVCPFWDFFSVSSLGELLFAQFEH